MTASDSSGSTRVIVLDTRTGAQIGNAVNVSGATLLGSGGLIAAQLNTQGTAAVLATRNSFGSGVRVAVIDITTGTQLGATLALDGQATQAAQFNSTGTRVIVTANDSFSTNATRVAVIDAATGAQVGTTIAVTGSAITDNSNPQNRFRQVTAQFTADGTRAVLTTRNFVGNAVTSATVIDTTTGTQLGTVLVAGDPQAPAQFDATGTRAAIGTYIGNSVLVALIDTGTGAQLGTTISSPASS